MSAKPTLGSSHYEFLERTNRHGESRTVDRNERRMVETTLTRLGLVTYERLTELTWAVRLTDAGREAVRRRGTPMFEGGTTEVEARIKVRPRYSRGYHRWLWSVLGWMDRTGRDVFTPADARANAWAVRS
jgi:hypothetical protein